MLLDLRISNLALIERAEIQCGPGLNILTGETGAGKSILIQALGLLTGERAVSEQVGQGSQDADGSGNGAAPAKAARALVEGSFDLSLAPRVLTYLREQDIPLDEPQLIIAREISADGRNRVRLNGRLATAAMLRELGGLLVDLHGQHEHQLLMRPEAHLGFLDAFGDAACDKLRAGAREKYEAWRATRRRLDDITRDEQQRAQRLDMLQFQAGEIDAAAPEAGEDALLIEERARLSNAEKLRASASLCRDVLLGGDEPGALILLGQALKAGREIESVDGSVSGWVEELQSALYELEDAAAEARAYAGSLEADPLRLEEIEARLHRLSRLKRKYGDSLERVLAYRAEVQDEIERLSMSEEELGALREEVAQRRAEFMTAAEKLSGARQKLAKRFAAEVVANLHTLAMEKARFEVGFERDEDGSADGIDRVEFVLSANPGQPLRPLARIASGGEISRVMLSLRSVLSVTKSGSNDAKAGDTASSGETTMTRVPVIVFDEIDVGIGGLTAEAVGEKMQELARRFQVFCVTHLPQIARRADRHYRVLKESDNERTRVDVRLLEGEERVRELARMMGRENEANLRHARAMLEK